MSQAVKYFLELRPRLREVREQESGWILGLFDYNPADAASATLISNLNNQGAVNEIRRDGKLLFPPTLGGAGVLELRFDTGNLPGYFESYDSLIRTHPDAAPENFVVWEKNEGLRAGYEAVCKLLLFLKTKAEVWDSTAQRFFLVDQQAVEIPLASYVAKQSVELPKQLNGIMRFLDAAHLDADARWVFFRKASLRLLRDLPSGKRLGALLENVANIFDRAQQDHSLYLERFSFEDLLKSFDEKRLKFVGDLNQILASIQTALIGVPIGFFLIAEKFKPTNGWIGQNIVLAGGGLVFFGLVFLLTLNQGKTLEAVKLALTDFETEQKRKVTDKSERLQKLLATTWSQYRRVRWLLWAVRVLLLLFSAIIVAALLWCSIPVWQNLLPYVAKDSTPPSATNGVATPKAVQAK